MAISDTAQRQLQVAMGNKTSADEIIAAIDDAAAGVVPAGSISNTELATDCKVGSLAALTTTAKSNVVAALNEIDGHADGKPDLVSPSVIGNVVSFSSVAGAQADSGVAAADIVTTATVPNTFSGTPATISPTAALATAPTFTASGKCSHFVQLTGNATACANTNNENADGAEITGAACVAAYSTVAAGAWAVGAITNPEYARNVAITIKNDSGGPLNLFEGVMTFTVTGTDWSGAALSETITITSTAGNKAVATANYRAKYGVKAFKTVTAVTLDNVPADGLKIGVGKGGKVSVHGTLRTPAEADMIQVVEDGSVLTITGNVDTTNGTFNFDAIAASKVISMLYVAVDGSSGTCSQPAVTVTGAAYTPAGTISHV